MKARPQPLANSGGPNPDDNDGMSDVWELANGCDPLNAADAVLDPDGDGLTNLEESIAGTDPGDGGSRFKVQGCEVLGAEATLSFESVIGRLYDVLYKDGLLDPTWQVLTTDIPGDGSVVEVPDTGAGTRRFYRIHVRLNP